MVDECEIVGAAGAPVLNEDTGAMGSPAGGLLYAGRCRVQMPQAVPGSQDAGEHQFSTAPFEVQLPMSTSGFAIGNTVTITRATLDPDLAGRVLTVVGLAHKTHMTARRLRCEEVQG